MISQSYSHWIQFLNPHRTAHPHELGEVPISINIQKNIPHPKMNDIPMTSPLEKHPRTKPLKFHDVSPFPPGWDVWCWSLLCRSFLQIRRSADRDWDVVGFWDVGFATDSADTLAWGWLKSLKITGQVEKVDEKWWKSALSYLSSRFESLAGTSKGMLSSPRTNIASPTRTMSLMAAIGFTAPLLTGLSGSS